MTLIDDLTASYDLTYRPTEGERSWYRLDIVYNTLDDRLVPAGRENYRGDFERVVTSATPERVEERITWRSIGRREAVGQGPFGEWQRLDFAEGFGYRFSAEDSYEDFHWDYASLPSDPESWTLGWNVLLLTVDAHFEFDFLRSRRHGAIDRLTRLGDKVVVPDSNTPFRLAFPPAVDVPAFNKQNLQLEFAALTRRHATDCARLRFQMDPSPFAMEIFGEHLPMSSQFEGTIDVRLSDGAIEHGEFEEFVFGGPTGVSPVYEIVRIDESDWASGGLSAE